MSDKDLKAAIKTILCIIGGYSVIVFIGQKLGLSSIEYKKIGGIK